MEDEIDYTPCRDCDTDVNNCDDEFCMYLKYTMTQRALDMAIMEIRALCKMYGEHEKTSKQWKDEFLKRAYGK